MARHVARLRQQEQQRQQRASVVVVEEEEVVGGAEPPPLPVGVEVGRLCLATVKHAGERKRFKAALRGAPVS